MPTIACAKRLTCECTDDPVNNFSSEAIDALRYRSLGIVVLDPPLGMRYFNLGCISLCESTISQEDADDCAYRQAVECVVDHEGPPWTPPPTTPETPGTPVTLFYNTAQFCTSTCPDGRTFTWSIPAGVVPALTQAQANAIAHSLACNRAAQYKLCIVNNRLDDACKNTSYAIDLQASGGVGIPWPYIGVDTSLVVACNSDAAHPAFSPIYYEWEIISGSLPPGLTLRRCSGVISGTPTTTGSYTFTVRVTDRIDSTQTKQFTICVFEITSSSPLPSGTVNTAYSQSLSAAPAPATETWSVLAGTLPPGLTLDAATGIIDGTPTAAGTFNFTVQLVATCT